MKHYLWVLRGLVRSTDVAGQGNGRATRAIISDELKQAGDPADDSIYETEYSVDRRPKKGQLRSETSYPYSCGDKMSKDDRNLVRILIGVVICVSLVGCTQTTRDDVEQLQAFLQKERAPVAGVQYRVLPPDVIGLSSKCVKEIDGVRRQVRPDGKISLPLIGEVFVAGKTLQEVAHELTWSARRYYKRADITVYMVGYNSQKIYVFGQVSRPGMMPWTGTDTLLSVLARVQPTLLSWPEKIKVVRGQSPKRGGYLPGTEQEDQANGAKELTIDLMAMVKKGDLSRNVFLWPDDVVYVPANPPAKVGLVIRQLLFPVGPVLDTLQVPNAFEDAVEYDDDDDYYNRGWGRRW